MIQGKAYAIIATSRWTTILSMALGFQEKRTGLLAEYTHRTLIGLNAWNIGKSLKTSGKQESMRCKGCGSEDADCYEGCDCAKCVDPEGYDDWKENNPEEYQDWLDRQKAEEEYF